MNKERISEFILALDEEINALKKGKGGNVTAVYNGRFLRQVSDFYVYVFNLENILATMDESPAEIEINGMTYEAQVLATQGMEVEVGIKQNLGKNIPEARLRVNMWYLLDLLKKNFEKCLNGEIVRDFNLSELIFSGKDKILTEKKPDYTISTDPPNLAQQNAIKASFSHQLSVIWGPPGTGKTKTIAMAIEAHLNEGRSVLLVSHSNNAVDEALEDVAVHLKPSHFYQHGELIRLGQPQEKLLKRLEEKCELVFPEKYSKILGKELIDEKELVKIEIEKYDQELSEINEIISLIDKKNALNNEVEQVRQSTLKLENDHKRLQSELGNFHDQRRLLNLKLDESRKYGTFKRFFSGMSPKKIENELKNIEEKNNYNIRLFKEIDGRARQLISMFEDKKAQLKKLDEDSKEKINNSKFNQEGLPERKKIIEENKSKSQKRIIEIVEKLNNLEVEIISKAKLIATTLTKTFISRQLSDVKFDVLILDEASMAPMPYLYWALSRCKYFTTIVGDFLQLPPIAISEGDYAAKWLKRSIFNELGIDDVDKAFNDKRVMLLDTQYRMAPDISEIPRKLFYENKIKDGKSASDFILVDGIAEKALVLIDTTEVNPWCSKIISGGRFNLYNALLCVTIARKILENNKECTIGIATSYSAQARLMNKIANDYDLTGRLHISTVHKFQGGQEDVIIFDTVESPGLFVAPMLDELKGKDSDAKLLLNVAITRTKKRIYFIGHVQHLSKQLTPGCVLSRVLSEFQKKAQNISSKSIVDNHFATDFEAYADLLMNNSNEVIINNGNIYNENNFWQQFINDISNVKNRLVIFSPFITLNRSSKFINKFKSLKDRNVEVIIYTRSRNFQNENTGSEEVIEQFRNIGVEIIERGKMHQKIALIDDLIVWEGSLNILSHHDTQEHMRRIEGKKTVNELIKDLDIGIEMNSNPNKKVCPVCGAVQVMKNGKFGKFLSCPNYPRCRGKR